MNDRECPVCHRVNRPGARECDECGWNFVTGRPGRRIRSEEKDRPGVFGLAVGTVIHPVATMDSFFYYVTDNAMLWKMFIFYLVSLPITGFIAGGGEAGHWAQGTLAEAAGFGVSVLCILLAGKLFAQSGSLVGTGVILGFVRAVVTFVMVLYAIGIVAGVMPFSGFVILIFLIWNLVLNVVALTNIFGCSGTLAFVISLIAGFLHSFVSKAIGISA